MSATLLTEPNWVDDDFFKEVEAMVPSWREPIAGLVNGSTKTMILPEESAQPDATRLTRAYASVHTANEIGTYVAGQTMRMESRLPLQQYCRMIDPGGSLTPVVVRSCVNPREDGTNYGRQLIADKLQKGWLLAERSEVAQIIFGINNPEQDDRKYGEALRKAFLARRETHASASQAKDIELRRKLEEEQDRSLAKQGASMTKAVIEALALQSQSSADNQEKMAATIAAAIATALANQLDSKKAK